MGARLLAFDAGDVKLARLEAVEQPAQQFTKRELGHAGQQRNRDWLSNMFTLTNRELYGQRDRHDARALPGQAVFFAYAPAAMGYYANGWAAASDPWGMPESLVQSKFCASRIMSELTRAGPGRLDSTCAQTSPARGYRPGNDLWPGGPR